MKRFFRLSLAIALVVLLSATTGQAERHGGGGGHGGGHGWGLGWGSVVGLGLGLGLLGLTYPYYGNPYYPGYVPAPVPEDQPAQFYAQPAPQQPAASSYWYYCQEPEGYYPYVKRCPDGWLKVVPAPPQP
jgi:hypothetical protein